MANAFAAVRTVRRAAAVTVVSTAPIRFRPLAVGTRPASTAGSAGSSSCSSTAAPGTRFLTSATCAATPSASDWVRSATAPGSASAGFWLRVSSIVAAIVHGPHTATFSDGVTAVGGLLKRIQVTLQQPGGVPQVTAGPGGEPPAAGGGLHRQAREHGGGPPGEVSARPPAGQLGQVREAGQLAEYDGDGLGRVSARHRSDAGGAAGRPGVRRRFLAHPWQPSYRTGCRS